MKLETIRLEKKQTLYSGLFRYKKIFVFFVFLAFLNLIKVGAVDFGMSPTYIFLEGNQGELLCENITIFCEGCRGKLILEDKWAPDSAEKNELKEYNFSANEMGIESYHLSLLLAESQKQIICFKAKKKGIFFGILMLQPEKSVFGVAIKIKIIANGSFSVKNKINSITGDAVLNSNKPNGLFLIVFLQNFILLICLIALFRANSLRKKRF